jgi:inhibitor of cysteine peptidase
MLFLLGENALERKIKRKAAFYGVAAVLMAVVLSAMFVDYGAYLPKLQASLPPVPAPASAFLTTFQSYDELKNFLVSNSATQGRYPYEYLDTTWFGSAVNALGPMKKSTAESEDTYVRSSPDYSSTNIQVAGVDEADIVKTDGEYIYTLSDGHISIVKAYPPETAVLVSTITFDKVYPTEFFISGHRLVVIGSQYDTRITPYYSSPTSLYYPELLYEPSKASMLIYDIHNKAHPTLLRDLTMTGEYFESRMTGDYVYFVVYQTAYIIYDTAILPKIYSDGQASEVAPSQIHYYNGSSNYYQYTTFVAANVQNATKAPTYLTVMLGGTSSMYVSPSNIYVTFREIDGNTTIYRVHFKESNMTCEANGQVPGNELNQFSMDEYNDHFRIVTTAWRNYTQQNNLYVLDMNLSIVGRLENLGVTENLHATRFMGNRCYIVTFKKTDPLFVINVSDPTNPTVLGELKIPGYSDYLHPYDENHLIGVGKEAVEAESGDFAWYQGIKIALFDVTNVSNPVQLANYMIGDRGSDSPVLSNHKAFLFDKSRNLLVLPVSVAKIDESQYPYGVPPYAYGTTVWQGAYVFNVTLTGGFNLKGRITHGTEGGGVPEVGYWVNRALYIENVLYTVSDKKVKMNNLTDLSAIGEVQLP